MKIKELRLKNYRNCLDIKIDLDCEKIIIIGKNAQGKTNILESIYFLSTLKSPRTTNNIELINHQKESIKIWAIIEKNNTEIEQNIFFDKNKKKETKTNKVKKTQKKFKNILKTVLFSTADLALLRGAPQERRAWLDGAISQIYPAHEERLLKYKKIRTQKNNLLKDAYNKPLNETLLEVFNEQMSVLGSNIIYLRKKYLKEIEKIAKEKHRAISKTEEMEIKYENIFIDNEKEQTAEEIQKKFIEKLNERKREERIRAQSLVGPHRDDVIFYINKQEATKFASQGQQRTIVLSLKLSELEIITKKTGEAPILLLDDVLAELDDTRQNYLLKTIGKDVQTIITSVDTLLFDEKFLEGVKIYNVEKGRIKNKKEK